MVLENFDTLYKSNGLGRQFLLIIVFYCRKRSDVSVSTTTPEISTLLFLHSIYVSAEVTIFWPHMVEDMNNNSAIELTLIRHLLFFICASIIYHFANMLVNISFLLYKKVTKSRFYPRTA